MDAGLQQVLEPYLAPIPGQDPCGADERHSHAYLEADSEAKKLGGIRQEPVDWERVLELSQQLLTTCTKDLKLAGCMTLALFYLEGYHGLDRGLHILVELLDTYWEQVHPRPRSPKNLRRRASPLIWLNDHLRKIFSTRAPTPSDAPAVVSIQASTQRYKEVCVSRFGNQSPAFEELLTSISRATQSMDLETAPAPNARPEAGENNNKSQAHPDDSAGSSVAIVPESNLLNVTSTDLATTLPSCDELSLPAELEALLAPISPDHPSGNNERYNEAFEQARAQAKRLDDQLSDKEPDWEITLDRSLDLLEHTTKDLNLAAFVTLAKYEYKGLQGLGDGLLLVAELIERFWDTIHPQPRNTTNFKRRSSPLSWLNKHVEKRLQAYDVQRTDGPDIARLDKVVARYAHVCNTRFERAAPPTRSLLEITQRLSVSHKDLSTPPVEPATPAEVGPGTTPPQSPSPKPQGPTPSSPAPTSTTIQPPELQKAPVEDLDSASDYLSKVGNSLTELASALRQNDATHGLSYRLHRQGVWMHLTASPPTTRGNKTSIPPLPDQVRQQLETLLKHENWTHLLDEAESRLGKFRFSLDLHRYVVLALKGVGQANRAIASVQGELCALLKRMPTLLDLEFSNGTPLADAQTKAWILREVISRPGTQTGSQAPATETWWEPVDQAMESGEKDLTVASMQTALRSSPDQIQFVQRALKGANELRSIPGLSLLLAHLAHEAVRGMSGSGRPADHRLETDCLRLLLQLRASKAAQSSIVVKNPELMPLAVELGQRDLANAIAYFAS